MSGAALRRRARCRQLGNGTKGEGVKVRLGVDIACRSPHIAACADESGSVLWSGRRFRTEASELEVLWARLPVEAAEVMVVMEPTRNAWVPLVGWFRRRGARVVLVPSEQSSDLRDYFSKHTKTDPLTELTVGVSQVDGQAVVWLATVPRHDHRRRCAAGLVPFGGAAARVA